MSKKDAPPVTDIAFDADEDYYALLGVSATASRGEVARAYRKLALKLHPDKSSDPVRDAAQFEAVTRARDVLMDAPTRAQFDALRKAKAERDARNAAASETQKVGMK